MTAGERWVPGGRPPERVAVGDFMLCRWRSADDAEELYATIRASRAHLEPWMPWASGHSVAAAQEYLNSCESGWDERTKFDYRITAACDATFVGSTGLMARLGPGALEIGYWVRADHIRRGIATRAAAALTVVGLSMAGVERIEIHHHEANAASGAIPRRLGYVAGGMSERIPGLHPDCPAGGPPSRLQTWVLHADDLPGSPAAALAHGAPAAP